MIVGKMDGLQPIIEVIFVFPDGSRIALEFVIDTGFAGYLTLPLSAVEAMNLPFDQEIRTNLADDSHSRADAHQAIIEWHGALIEISVLAMSRRPLLGTSLLAGYGLNAEFVLNGRVEISDIP